MSPAILFQLHLVSGYLAWALCFGAYLLPWLRSMERADAFRAMATLHSFRFFGLVFLLPGVVGPNLPSGFATFAAYGDLATAILAMLALVSFRVRPLFWSFVVAFNVVGVADLIVNYYHATQDNLPALAGQLGATYAIPILYVPVLMLTHGLAFYWLLRRQPDDRSAYGVHIATGNSTEVAHAAIRPLRTTDNAQCGDAIRALHE